MSTSKREVASLLRRCIGLAATTIASNTISSIQHHETILTALDMLPSYDTSSITEAIGEIVENRLIPKLPPVLRSSALTRRSHRRALSSGSLGKTPPTSIQQILGGSPSAALGGGGGGGLLLSTTPTEASPFGTSMDGGEISANGATTLSGNVIDSALFSKEEQDILAYVLRNGLASEADTASAIQDMLLVLLVDQHTPSYYARQNAAVLYGALFSSGFCSPSGSGDPFEKLYDVFSGTRSGIVTPDQCVAIAIVLRTSATTNSPTAAAAATGKSATLSETHALSPYRTMLLDLLCRTTAFHVANALGRPPTEAPPPHERTPTCLDPDEIVLPQQQILYAPVWYLHDLLAPPPLPSDSIMVAVTTVVPPPCAIGATPPLPREVGAASGDDEGPPLPLPPPPPPPPPYAAVGQAPPSYQLHISQQSHGSGGGAGNSRSGGEAALSGEVSTNGQHHSDSSSAPRMSATGRGGGGRGPERFQPAPPSLHLHHHQQHASGTPLHVGASVGVGDHRQHRDPSNVSLEQHVALQRVVLTAAQREEAKIRTVYINKLDPKITEGQLRDYLDRCGQVLRVRLCGELVGRTKYGFVEFNHSDAAKVLIAKDRDMLAGCAIRCSLAKQPIQDVDSQLDAVIDPKRGLTRACLFGYVRKGAGGQALASPATPMVAAAQSEQSANTSSSANTAATRVPTAEPNGITVDAPLRTVLGGLRIAGVST